MAKKKKSQKKVVTKKKPEVAKVFKCPFCAHDKVVECRINRKEHIGTLSCRVCGASYETNVTYLTEAIDIFCEWLDECAKEETASVQS